MKYPLSGPDKGLENKALDNMVRLSWVRIGLMCRGHLGLYNSGAFLVRLMRLLSKASSFQSYTTIAAH